jgi:aminoglycoside 3-N-acetyltransferase
MNSCAVLIASERRWISYPGIRLNDSDFEQLGKAFEAETAAVTAGPVGDGVCRLFDLRAAVNFAVRWMPANRTGEDDTNEGDLARPEPIGKAGAGLARELTSVTTWS